MQPTIYSQAWRCSSSSTICSSTRGKEGCTDNIANYTSATSPRYTVKAVAAQRKAASKDRTAAAQLAAKRIQATTNYLQNSNLGSSVVVIVVYSQSSTLKFNIGQASQDCDDWVYQVVNWEVTSVVCNHRGSSAYNLNHLCYHARHPRLSLFTFTF